MNPTDQTSARAPATAAPTEQAHEAGGTLRRGVEAVRGCQLFGLNDQRQERGGCRPKERTDRHQEQHEDEEEPKRQHVRERQKAEQGRDEAEDSWQSHRSPYPTEVRSVVRSREHVPVHREFEEVVPDLGYPLPAHQDDEIPVPPDRATTCGHADPATADIQCLLTPCHSCRYLAVEACLVNQRIVL
jgi:hypothetical protein